MSSRVMRSAEGLLFLTGGSNDVLQLFSPAGFARAVDLAAWHDRLAARDALFAERGIPWRLLLAPEKLSVLGQGLLGADAIPPARRFLQALPHPAVIDPAGYLCQQHAAGYSVYPATDSHWTSIGAFSAFQWLMADMGIALDYAAYAACAPLHMRYHGDLWDTTHADLPPDLFERRSPPPSLHRIHANTMVEFKERHDRENDMRLHTGSHVIYRNDEAQNPGRLLLFGSSFSDHRAECSLLTFAAAVFFREVHFIWSTSLDTSYLDRVEPDLVLVEMPERFLPLCPRDDLDLEAHAATRLADWRD